MSFDRFARWTEHQVGSPTSFAVAVAVIVLWAVSGPFFGWSDTWQLVINTGTTIITFLMVFLIQSTQSRDTRALHLKLDELIRVNQMARNSLLNLEDMSETEIQEAEGDFRPRCRRHAGQNKLMPPRGKPAQNLAPILG